MPSSEVRYQRGDVYRHYDEDILRARRSSSSTSSVLSHGAKNRRGVNNQNNSATHLYSSNNGLNNERLVQQPPNISNATSTVVKKKAGGSSEYLTKKKVEVKTTKNTERRVQRCIVLEDGRIIEHDDPHIVVDTIEDTQTHDFDHLEDQSLARELQASIKRSYQKAGIPYNEAAAAAELKGQQRKAKKDRRKSLMCEHPETYVKNNKNNLISGDVVRTDTTEEDGSIVNDTFKRIVNTHDVRENVVRTHAAKDLGTISQKGLRRVLKKQGKVSDYLRQEDSSTYGGGLGGHQGTAKADHHRGSSSRHQQQHHQTTRSSHRSTHPNINKTPKVHKYESESHKRVVDTEDIHQISRRLRNGQIRSETFRTEKHEVFDNKQAPDTDKEAITGSSETEHEKEEQKFRLTKTRDFTDYYDAKGKLLMSGPDLTSRDLKVVAPKDPVHDRWVEIGEDQIKQTRQSLKKRLRPTEDAERTDALTKRPLDLNKEEKTRQKETNKWLERHFGSDWSLAGSSSGGSRLKNFREGRREGSQFDTNAVRRTMSFSSIPIQYTNPGEKVSRVIKQTTTTIRPGFDKQVVSSITKTMAPKEDRKQQHIDRPYHSTLTLATDGRHHLEDGVRKGHHASTTSLLNETSKVANSSWRQVPIQRAADEDSSVIGNNNNNNQQPRPRTRVQRLIDEHGSNRSRSIQNRRSYYYGEDPRVQSEPPRRVVNKNSGWETCQQKRNTPLYRTELLKTSNRMTAIDHDEDLSSLGGRRSWRDELSKSYHDISWNHQKTEKIHHQNSSHRQHDLTQSYSELPKPSQLFGWSDELRAHSYGHRRAAERSDAHPNLQRSKSFASPSSDHSSNSDEVSYRLLHGLGPRSRGRSTHGGLNTKSYKDTKVSEPPRDYGGHYAGHSEMKEVHHSKTASKMKTLSKKTNHHKKSGKMASAAVNDEAVYEFERKIPMQSSILEAQKFKTVIFVSGN